MPLVSHAFLGAPAARPVLSFPVSLVSTAGPRALPLPARCGTQFDSRHRESERRPPVRLRYASSTRGMGRSQDFRDSLGAANSYKPVANQLGSFPRFHLMLQPILAF